MTKVTEIKYGAGTGWTGEAPLRKGDGDRDLNAKESVRQGEGTVKWQKSEGRKVLGELELSETPEAG